ncbi:MAG: peptidylprolyl isomerase [Syntrophorhabdaceae bacterium]
MKYMKRIAIALVLILACGVVVQAEIVDRVIAIINDDIVTMKDFEAFVKIDKRTKFTSIDEYFRNLQMRERLETFIEAVLIKQQAKKLGINVGDQEVAGFVKNIQKQNLITDAELREQLKKDKVTYEQFLEGLKLNMLRTRLMIRVISTEVNITENSLKSYYDSHQQLFRDEEYHIQQIFVSGQHKDIKERADQAYKQLTQGVKFEDVARKWSDDPSANQGGDIGFVKKSDLLPTLRDAVVNLPPGSYSMIIPTPYGLHILKLVELKKAEVLPYEAVKTSINERMVMEESSKRYKDYMDRIKKTSYIEIKI